MAVPGRRRVTLALSLVAAAALPSGTVSSQGHTQPADDLSNPYRPVENHFKLAEGRWWGSTSAVDIDIDGRSIWVAERCAANSCAGSKLNPVLKFDASGRLRRRFGEGMFIFPHGIHVDREGNVWVTDAQGPDGKDPDRDGKGHAVYKFSPTGRLLLTLGTPGVAGDGTGALLNGPSDVVTAPNGDIFVTDGAGGQDADAPPSTIARIVKYAKDGTFVTAWGAVGSGPGELRTPHGLALDARGRLFVADHGNARIQIFDQEGRFLDAWTQFGRASGIYIDHNDLLYAASSGSSDSTAGWEKGIRIGSARDGTVMYFIPDSQATPTGTSGVAGVAVDGQGNVFGASVHPRIPPQALMKYVRQ
ncbi:MAG: SMP-30/gluconolactonase/LRE family protein [Gemmatimonadetes bacterium]|nr:SMP-30/gluconolactonase/LRE family protein [Gemmatimonadota bacterium]